MRYGGLIIAIAFAAIAAVVVLRMMANNQPPPPAATGAAPVSVNTVDIFVAAAPIPVGSAITQEMIITQPWPENLVLDGFIRAQPGTSGDTGTTTGSAAVVGMVARAPFQAQEPIIRTKLANPNDPNFLAADLPKGMRVVTIKTSETQGIAGFLFPGDHVDVMVTHKVEEVVAGLPNAQGEPGAPKLQPKPVTETVLTNVKVVAVDQRSTNEGSPDDKGKLLVPKSVSLMVSLADAQRLRLAEDAGTLTLALRSVADRDSADPLIFTQPSDISQHESSGAPVGVGGGSVTIYRGVEKDKSAGGGSAFFVPVPLPASAAAPLTPRVAQ